MKSKFILLGLLIVLVSDSYGQFSGGIDLGVPTGSFSDLAKTGFGGSIRYDQTINDKVSWTASLGYLSFSGNTFTINNVSIPFGNSSIVPIAGGIKYYFSGANSGFYGAADLGLFFISYYSYTYNSGGGGGYNTASDSSIKLGLAPGIGYKTGNWDFAGRFNLIEDVNYFSLRAAYVFGEK